MGTNEEKAPNRALKKESITLIRNPNISEEDRGDAGSRHEIFHHVYLAFENFTNTAGFQLRFCWGFVYAIKFGSQPN